MLRGPIGFDSSFLNFRTQAKTTPPQSDFLQISITRPFFFLVDN